MLTLELSRQKGESLKVLCLGAHSDDIEIGCGGTILNLIEQYKSSTFYWVVLSAGKKRKKEAQQSADALLTGTKDHTIAIKEFKDGFFPYIGGEIKEYFERLKRKNDPDIIFTHYRSDLHQDHRLISELTWNTFRDHLILEYEIPKYDGDFGSPNFFVHLEEAICIRKVHHIIKNFESQAENQWFTKETFRSILRLRGIESNSPSGYAEGFYSRKIVLG
jgi:LmbE family N-acetylglucosaminyl deacetylase